ncbi:MAG TPA: hypothetical protein VGB26_09745 [Nitrospiria bacterium]
MKPISLLAVLGFLFLVGLPATGSAYDEDRPRGQVHGSIIIGSESPFYASGQVYGVYPFYVLPGLGIQFQYGDYSRQHLHRGHHGRHQRPQLHNGGHHRRAHWQQHPGGHDRHFDRKDRGHTKKHQRRFGSH